MYILEIISRDTTFGLEFASDEIKIELQHFLKKMFFSVNMIFDTYFQSHSTQHIPRKTELY